ncbi:transposase, partial [Rubidibacter lacunae]|uniref:transposase n=1 Tax=Rubidibacter lacunae TaxID=582514 RepID=UPI0008FEE277
EAAKGTRLERAQVTRLRATLIKVAGRVRTTARRVLIDLSSHCPYAEEIRQIARQLCGASATAQ